MTSGASYVLRGFTMWRRRPGLMLLGMVPALVVSAVLLAAYVVLLLQLPDLVRWLTPFVDGSADLVRVLVRLSVALVIVVGALALAASTFMGLTLAVGDPFYARIWRETELMLGGSVPDGELGTWRAARDAVVLMVVSVAASVVVVIVGLLPLVGTVVGALLGLAVSGWLLASDLLARPLEARGLDAAQRTALTRGSRSSVLGFGVTVQAFFLAPLGAVIVMPAAVVGATMLARDLVEEGSALRGQAGQDGGDGGGGGHAAPVEREDRAVGDRVVGRYGDQLVAQRLSAEAGDQGDPEPRAHHREVAVELHRHVGDPRQPPGAVVHPGQPLAADRALRRGDPALVEQVARRHHAAPG